MPRARNSSPHLYEDIRAVRVCQVDGFCVDDRADRRLLLVHQLLHARPEPIGVGKEERTVDTHDDDARNRHQALVA